MMKSKKSVSLFLVALAIGSLQSHRASAAPGGIDKVTSIDISEKSGDRKYDLKASASSATQKVYQLTENKYQLNESIAGNSQAGTADEKPNGDLELNGFYTLTITKVSETEISLRFSDLRLQMPDGLHEYADEVTASAKFTGGDWSAYVAGKPVEILVSKRGLTELNQDFTHEMISTLLPEIREGIAAQRVPSSVQEKIKGVTTQFDGAILAGALDHLDQKYDLGITGSMELRAP